MPQASIYSELADIASELAAEFKQGDDLTAVVAISTTAAASSLGIGAETETDHLVNLISDDGKFAQTTGMVIQAGEIVVFFSSAELAFSPVAGKHRFRLNGELWAISEVVPIPAAASPPSIWGLKLTR